MKILLSIKKYFLENWFPIGTITIITLFVWHKVLFQVPNGEGFMYFSPLYAIDSRYFSIKFFLQEHSNLAKIIFAILMPVIKNNLTWYMSFQLLIMLLVYQTYYFVIVKITKDKIVSFLATIFFVANYVGSFTMFGIGNYHRFIQRIPSFPFIFISFYFLFKYLDSRKIKHLYIAFVLFIIFILLAHFNVLFLPIFIVYPIVYFLLYKQKSGSIKLVSISLFFIILSILLTRGDSLSRPNYSPLVFIKETPKVAQMVLYQISSTAFPQQLTVYLSKIQSPQIPYPYLPTQNLVLIFITIIFVVGLIKGRKYPQALPLYVTFIITLFFLSFMIIYAYDADPNPLKFFGEDRIYFSHSIFIAFVWAAWVKFFFGGNKKVYLAATILIGTVFLIHNTSLIWNGMSKYQYRSNMYKAFIDYTKNLSQSFTNKTVIVAPPDLIRTTDPFVRRFYNLDKATFIALENGWRELVTKTKADKKNVFVLDYKYSYDSKNDIDPLSVTIVDKSADFRSNKKIVPFVKP